MAQELLAELHRRGIRLRVVDGALDVIAPSGALTPELHVRLKDARDDLIALIDAAAVKEGPGELTAAPQDRFEPFPLTDLQHSYWIGRGSAVELGGVSSHYYFEVERTGLDPERLAAAWRRVIDRHDMLRMTVLPDGRQQVRSDVPEYQMPVADLREVPEQARQQALEATREELDHQVLPADAWPLFDIRISLLPGDRVRLHISLDVLILDGYSLFLLFSEWRRFYEEPDWRPEPLDVFYRDYVLHEEAERGGARYAEDERYWMQRLETLAPAPDLPLAKQPGNVARTRFERRAGRLSRDRWQAIKDRARTLGLTPSNVLLAGYAEVLRRWSAQPDFTVNLTLFNRPAVHPRIGELVGDFTSVTLCEARAGAGETFAERVRAVQQQLLRDLDHSAFNGVRVLRERARRIGGGPGAAMPVVFTSALVLGGGDEDVSDGIRFFGDEVYAITQTPQVWLDHQVSEEHGDLVFNWDAVPELFPAGMLDDMFAAYCGLLDRLAADPRAFQAARPLAELPGWQRAERDEANATEAPIAARTLGELVEEQAALRPDAPAVLAHDGELTYRQTVVHARRLARRLADLGAATGELVAVVLDKGWEQVPAVLGVNLSGAAYLPIDPRWPQNRREELLAQGRCRIVVTSAALREELQWPDGVTQVTLSDEQVRAASSEPVATGPKPEDLAYVIFTSGSTGRPKGVMIDNRGAANTVQDVNARFGIGPEDRVLALSALSFDLSVYDVFGVLAAGGAVVVPEPAAGHDPARWGELMTRHAVTVWNSVPALMQAWVDAAARLTGPAPAGLRLALLSGDWIPVTLPDAVRALHPGTEVISLGGATEASIWSIHFPIGDVPPDWVRIPYGKPLANQTMHVLDERMEPVPVWVTGEIFIGGAGVALGYFGDAERTAERFVDHPVTGERLYRTGDLGRYLPGGDIEFLGRRDGQVKLNGYRIELGEIEAALLRQPGVAEAVAGVAENPATGRRQLVAHVVTADGESGAARADSEQAAAPPTWRRAVEAGSAEVRRALDELAADLDAYREAWRGVERLCPLIMARTLASVGAFQNSGATGTAVGIAALAKAKAGYAPLIGQWLAVLADHGLLRPTGRPGEYASPEPLDAARLDDQIRTGFAELPVRDDHRVLADYVAACAEHQVELLRGTVSPLELLIGGDSTAVTEALYATNPVSHLQNRVAARAVRAFVDRSSTERPLRVLEVGAGTGATSALVLRDLPSGRVHYSFTDVSAYFTERAKRRFRDYVFVDYGVFDVDREPAAQGVAPGSVDIVIAANVLHDAKDLDRTLRALRSTLVPGGLLVAVEGTANYLVQMVSVGFIEGLGHHADQRELPLLDVEQWRTALAEAGFARFAPVPDGEAAVDVHVQHVLLAGTAEDAAGLDPAVLAKALGELLPDYMVPHHILPVERIPLSSNGKVDRAALPVPWDGLAGSEPVAPRDELETTLVGLWTEVLERGDFGVEDSFFELGGDSLHAVAILGRLRDDFGLDLTADEGLELLFDHPTVAALAEVLRDRQGS